ncbi:MAG: NAD-dependent deacylase [Saprospiraceae bacterium]|nr:NAD-dependent deacylase [Candidatus Vicinibacter proximus]MBL7823262.1 NAD-dependent deacylase [Saprospiraceae bacterium]
MKQKLVVLTGAGMSAESGISTFRDAGGLWEGHDVMEVASPEGWRKNRELVLDFYNQRRRQLLTVNPNHAHYGLAELESQFDVHILTQNVDDLHERAGSSKVLHLHGELLKVRSTGHPELVYEWKKDLNAEDRCEKGFPLRPHIVWFGEEVPLLYRAMEIAQQADYFVIIGTSLQVYPAAGLLTYTPEGIPMFYIDKNPNLTRDLYSIDNLQVWPGTATEGVEKLKDFFGKI